MRGSKAQSGFTLVELAVVLLIIGLIVGGILRGQELIASAQLNAVQTDANQIRRAVNTFQDKFIALPGDMSDPTLIDTSSADVSFDSSDGGDGDGQLDGQRVKGGDEPVQAWVHLAASGMIDEVNAAELDGSDLTAANGFEGSVGGFYSLGQGLGRDGADIDFQSVSNNEIWLMLGTHESGRRANDRPVLPADQAAQLDRKIDDGDPSSGTLRGDWFNAGNDQSSCMDRGAAEDNTEYNIGGGSCAIAFPL